MGNTMDNNSVPQNQTGISLLVVMWVIHLITILDKATITFILGTIVLIMAGYHYFLQIKKTRRELKKLKNKQDA